MLAIYGKSASWYFFVFFMCEQVPLPPYIRVGYKRWGSVLLLWALSTSIGPGVFSGSSARPQVVSTCSGFSEVAKDDFVTSFL